MASDDSKSSNSRVAIIVALIGLAGTLLTVIINKWPINPAAGTELSNRQPLVPANHSPDTLGRAPSGTIPEGKEVGSNSPASVTLTKTKYFFPGDGEKNNNSSIGDFCCTGETATVTTATNHPVGYIYYYDFTGGLNISATQSAASTFSILISGISDINDLSSSHIKRSIDFTSNELNSGAEKTIQAGALIFKATILDVTKYSDPNYYLMDKMSCRVDVSISKN